MKYAQTILWSLLAGALLLARDPLMDAVRTIFADQEMVITGVGLLAMATILAFALLGVRSWNRQVVARNGGVNHKAQSEAAPDRRDYRVLDDKLGALEERMIDRLENTERLVLDVRDIAVQMRTHAQSHDAALTDLRTRLLEHIASPSTIAHS